MAIAPFTLRSATTNAAAPFCLGHAFVQGEVPSGSTLAAGSVQLQCIPKNAWPDGSLKFAVLAGIASITGGVDLAVTPAIGSPVTGTPLALAALKSTGVAASIGCGEFGTTSWATTDWDTPFKQWVSGPVMSSWIYRKPVGSDAHLVSWLEVRLWANGAVEILPWIENGYILVAAPTNKSATYTFTLGGAERVSVAIDLKHHQRTPLINGAALSYWLAADPGIVAMPDPAYLQASRLVPTYQAVMSAGHVRITAQPATYAPMQMGSFTYGDDYMPGGGYQRPIGLLPEHDVLYLVANQTDRATIYKSVVRNGFSAGRWSIHYRDENTNRPLRFSQYPTLNIRDLQGFRDTGGSTTGSYTPVVSGGGPGSWDVAHCPSVGFQAYLLTGRWYFMEQVQFATCTNYLGNGNQTVLRDGSKGLVQPCWGAWQTRSAAWDWRSRVQALCVTPDDDTELRNEFIASVEANIDHFHGRYVAQANNPFGAIQSSASYREGSYWDAMWMQDFVTAAFGYSISLGLPMSSGHRSKLAAFFQWKAKSVVGRLGASDAEFWYVNPVPYETKLSTVQFPDFVGGTGPWLANWSEVYDQTYTPPPAWGLSSVEGTYLAEIMPGADALIGNMTPAIAYAVEHEVPGAAEGYARITGATNYPSLAAQFNSVPVWSVAPAASSGESIVPTPGPTMRVGQLLTGKMAIAGFRGRGITPGQTATGFEKPSLLERHIVGADPTSEFLWIADTVPAGLTLNINEDSSFDASAADGVYNGTKTVRINGAEDPGTYQMAFGSAVASAPGATITGTGQIIGGAATAGVAPAPPADASAPGATLTGIGQIDSGVATGGIAPAVPLDVVAPGAAVTGTASIAAGQAFGNLPATIFGVTGPRSKARTFVVSDPQAVWDTSEGIGTFWNLSNPARPKGIKDPQAVVDIPFDWRLYFADAEDGYGHHEFILTNGLVLAATDEDAEIVTAFLAGGAIGMTAAVTCRVYSTSTPPRVEDRTVFLRIKER